MKSKGVIVVLLFSVLFIICGVNNVYADVDLYNLDQETNSLIEEAYLKTSEKLNEDINLPFKQMEFLRTEDYLEKLFSTELKNNYQDVLENYMRDNPTFTSSVELDKFLCYVYLFDHREGNIFFFYGDPESYNRYLMPSMSECIGYENVRVTYTNDSEPLDNSVKELLEAKINNVLHENDSLIETVYDFGKDCRYEAMDLTEEFFGDNPEGFKAIRNEDLYAASYRGVLEIVSNPYVTFGKNDLMYIVNRQYELRLIPKIYIPKNITEDDEIIDYVNVQVGPYISNLLLIDIIMDKNNNELNFVLWNKELEDYFDNSQIGDYRAIIPDMFWNPLVNNRVRFCTDYLEGDLDRNGVVDANDASIALELFKNESSITNDITIGDLDNNNIVDANDASLILELYKINN